MSNQSVTTTVSNNDTDVESSDIGDQAFEDIYDSVPGTPALTSSSFGLRAKQADAAFRRRGDDDDTDDDEEKAGRLDFDMTLPESSFESSSVSASGYRLKILGVSPYEDLHKKNGSSGGKRRWGMSPKIQWVLLGLFLVLLAAFGIAVVTLIGLRRNNNNNDAQLGQGEWTTLPPVIDYPVQAPVSAPATNVVEAPNGDTHHHHHHQQDLQQDHNDDGAVQANQDATASESTYSGEPKDDNIHETPPQDEPHEDDVAPPSPQELDIAAVESCLDDIATDTCRFLQGQDPAERVRLCSGKAGDQCPQTCRTCPPDELLPPYQDDCADNARASFLVDDQATEWQRCEWFHTHPHVRDRVCVQPHVREKCPLTCGVCRAAECGDSPNHLFVNEALGLQPCAWLADRPGHRNRLCQVGHEGWEHCPASCGRCAP